MCNRAATAPFLAKEQLLGRRQASTPRMGTIGHQPGASSTETRHRMASTERGNPRNSEGFLSSGRCRQNGFPTVNFGPRVRCRVRFRSASSGRSGRSRCGARRRGRAAARSGRRSPFRAAAGPTRRTREVGRRRLSLTTRGPAPPTASTPTSPARATSASPRRSRATNAGPLTPTVAASFQSDTDPRSSATRPTVGAAAPTVARAGSCPSSRRGSRSRPGS
jgi:hypothetical protein